MGLENFGRDVSVAVFGAGGGIGQAFVRALAADDAVVRVHAITRDPDGIDWPEGVEAHACDALDEDSLAATAEAIAEPGPLHLCIVAAGMLHGEGIEPEKTWRHIDAAAMTEVLRVNTVLPALVAKHMLPLLATEPKSCFAALSARVGSIGDNRKGGWVSYRASKAALNMVVRTLSIELKRRNEAALMVGLHPGTVDTGLSEPFQSNVPDEQLFDAADSVDRMLAVLDDLEPSDSGHLYAYDGERIEP